MEEAEASEVPDGLGLGLAAEWVQRHGFRRIAVQLPDEVLGAAARAIAKLQKGLPGRKVFLLGDSTYGSSSVDEVGAEHYGADCIVHVGSSDQEHAGTLPVLFLAARAPVPEAAAQGLVAELQGHLEGGAVVLLICDAAVQHLAGPLANALGAVTALDNVMIAEPLLEASVVPRGDSRCRRDWRFGVVPVAAWWAALGPITLAAAASPEPLRVCGRRVRRAGGGPPARLLPGGSVVYVGSPGSPLERRLLLRHGHARAVWRLEPSSGAVTRLSSEAILLRRHRFVELVRSAGAVGLLLCATGSSHGAAVAERLEVLLQRAGRRVYRFVIGRVTPEKLGNFREIDCFVSLASPEHFPFEARDFHVPIASPYEVEVALGAREWTGSYVTDLEELLAAPLRPQLPDEEVLPVQSLGAGARLRLFNGPAAVVPLAAPRPKLDFAPAGSAAGECSGSPPAPAVASSGLHGVAGRYTTEGGAGLRD